MVGLPQLRAGGGGGGSFICLRQKYLKGVSLHLYSHPKILSTQLDPPSLLPPKSAKSCLRNSLTPPPLPGAKSCLRETHPAPSSSARISPSTSEILSTQLIYPPTPSTSEILSTQLVYPPTPSTSEVLSTQLVYPPTPQPAKSCLRN